MAKSERWAEGWEPSGITSVFIIMCVVRVVCGGRDVCTKTSAVWLEVCALAWLIGCRLFPAENEKSGDVYVTRFDKITRVRV